MSRIQCFQLRQRQSADASCLAGGEATAAALQQPHRDLQLAGFQPLLSPPFFPEPKELPVGLALGEILQGVPPVAQISGIGRVLKRANRLATVASAIWLSRAVPATVERIWAVVAGSRSSFSSSKARAGCSSSQRTRNSRNSATSSGIMIREKSVLAEEIVGSGEEWLGGFDVKQLRDLVALEEGG